MKHRPVQSPASLALAMICLALCLTSPTHAGLLYYLPFEDGAGSSTLANEGSKGGTATVDNVTGGSSSYSTDTPSTLASDYSRDFPMGTNTQEGPMLILPDSASELHINTGGDSMTVSAWIKWDGPDGHGDGRQGIVSKLNGGQNADWAFSVTSGGALRFNIGNVGNRTSTATVSAGTWTHVAVTYIVGSGLLFYIDGVNDGWQSFGGIETDTSADTIRVGALTPTNIMPVNGALDDLAIWDGHLASGKTLALSTAPAVWSGYDAGVMDQLFTLYDAANPATTVQIGNLTWRYEASLPGGHNDGDSWMDGQAYIQISGTTGLRGTPEFLYWDTDGATAGTPSTASGDWNGATSNWSLESTGESATSTWVDGVGAVFSAGAPSGTQTVSVSGSRTVDSMQIEEGSVHLQGGGDLSVTAPLTISSNTTLIFDVSLTAPSMTVNSNGRLGGTGTFTGNVTVESGAELSPGN